MLEVSDVMGPTSAEMDMAIRDLTSLQRLIARKSCGGIKLPHLRGVTRLTNLRVCFQPRAEVYSPVKSRVGCLGTLYQRNCS
jgi:hypothetical protein